MQTHKTGDVAKLVGINIETLRYYERIGLVSSPSRTNGGHRTYSDDDIRKLAFIKRGRELEFSIEEIRALLDLATPEKFSCERVQELASARLKAVREKLALLREAESVLAAALEKCPATPVNSCPVINELERSASCCVASNGQPAQASGLQPEL
jgi:MerR family transcriptional regulator, mercuric resistance operon regulatory protein